MKRIALYFTAAMPLGACLALSPAPVAPVSWQAPAAPGYTGAHAVNNKLAGLQVITLGAESGPEHLALGRDGKLYAGVGHGKILRMDPDGTAQEVFADTGGRVLGFDFDASGNLIAADVHKGLLSISPEGKVTLLADSVAGTAIRFADAVAVASNGKIYLSDASTRFAAAPGVPGGIDDAGRLDILENSATGRVIEYDPATRATRIVAKGLSFANGLVLNRDETALLVAETARYRVWRIDLSAHGLDIARSSPQATVLFDNLPGFPDNLTRGRDGKIWLGLCLPRSAALDRLSGWPFLRAVAARLPKSMLPAPPSYGHVMAFTEDGKVVADLQDPRGAFPHITGITETADRLYVQNLNAAGLGWLPR
ncbi:SMP-30/gluconolactonase/LRE family protein [Pseudoduganella sp. LjRoot289]|uniref:SMP-30/gluconolactonase/LRE family protein n=1 Tax=Pseudoduganella sp. LjRoot289 TaxID=3342314 RepID=UPI003ECECA72